MKLLRQLVPVALAGMIGGALACGDSTGSGKQAASVTGVAGDSQVAPTGATFAFPLSLVALGSNGVPIQGVTVNWTVTPAGGALFNPQSSQTDDNGIASTSVRAGTDTGVIVIHANVPGVGPVDYHALVLNPCTYLAPYTLGQSINGALAGTDCQPGQFFYDLYDLNLPAPQSLRITMRWSGPPSTDTLDAYVELYRVSDGHRVGFDDDSILGVRQNSQLDIILPADHYFVGASSFGPFDTGPYTLSSQVRPAAMSGCRQVWMLSGTTVADSVTATDCADSTATPHHYDVARIMGIGGTVLNLTQRSTVMNPRITLYQLNCDTYARTLVASNDDSSGTNTNAFVSYAVPAGPASSCFDVLLSTSAAGETGAYTFEVSSSSTSPPASTSRITGREFWRGRSLLPPRMPQPKP